MSRHKPMYLAVSLDVEEEGLFGGRYVLRNPGTRNVGCLTRLEPLLERGVTPTLFCAHSVFADGSSRRVIDGLRERYPLEIGAHLHHWNTPPIKTLTDGTIPAEVGTVPASKVENGLMAAKLETLLKTGECFAGTRLTSFRMGRWDAHASLWPMLAANGILCDASVRPLHCGARAEDGPDHFCAPANPYWIETGCGRIFEVPFTVVPLTRHFRGSRRLVPGRVFRSTLKHWGALALLPVQYPLWLLKFVTRLYARMGGMVLSLTWHSSEMMPGGAPHIRTEKAVNDLLAKIGAYIDWLGDNFSLAFTTMDNLRLKLGPVAPVLRPQSPADWCLNLNTDVRELTTGAEAAPQTPLPGDLPHVAYVLLWYPLFTQPFIFREVECLREIAPVEVYTLYGRNLRHCSLEMRKKANVAHAFGARAFFTVLKNLILEAARNPLKLWRIFRRGCCYRWRSLEVLGENFWAFCVGITLARRFRQDGIDFVYAPWPRGTATAASVGAELAGLPFAIAARGDNLEPADPDLGDKLERACFVRANNAADKARIEMFGNGSARGKTELLYNSLTLRDAKRAPRPLRLAGAPVRLLALGRFDVTKGFDVLLRACAIMRKKGLDFHLTLAGGGGRVMGLGNLGKRLLELRRSLDLEDRVDMPGLVSHDDLVDILASHDVFVAPCVVHESGRRDGIPNTVIEAMANGLPVVSTDVNGLPEIVRNGETGLTVAPGDEEALARAIIWMSGHPAEAAEMGANGARLAAEIFDPLRNAMRLAGIFGRYYQPDDHAGADLAKGGS